MPSPKNHAKDALQWKGKTHAYALAYSDEEAFFQNETKKEDLLFETQNRLSTSWKEHKKRVLANLERVYAEWMILSDWFRSLISKEYFSSAH